MIVISDLSAAGCVVRREPTRRLLVQRSRLLSIVYGPEDVRHGREFD